LDKRKRWFRLVSLVLGIALALAIASQTAEAFSGNNTAFECSNRTITSPATNNIAYPEHPSSASELSVVNGPYPARVGLMPSMPITYYFTLVFNNACLPIYYDENVLYNMARVHAPQAWGCAQGEGVIIAILDTGVDSDHPDLQPNLVAGASFISSTISWEDDHGHGTHVSGIAAGIVNNGGIFGVAPRASIMPIKVCDHYGSCPEAAIANGIIWAVDHGARVINMSLGGAEDLQVEHDAVVYAYNHGVVIICSAGNSGILTDTFPAAYTEVIAVAATDANDDRASWSTYGDFVDVAAPGVSIFSSYPWNTSFGLYTYMSGTSMAAPHVTGMAALIRELRPDWTIDQVFAHIRASVDDVGVPGYDTMTGSGRINAFRAVDPLNLAATDALVTAISVQLVTEPTTDNPTAYTPGVVLYKLRNGIRANTIQDDGNINSAGLRTSIAVAAMDVMQLSVPAGEELYWLEYLRSLPDVAYAELDGIRHIQ
jgi:subtilisin family serine protease